MSIRLRTASALIACTLLVAACGDSQQSSSSGSEATTTATKTPSARAGTRVSANTASSAEIVAALEAAGVANADRWAREVEEYRPYDNDPNLPQLRQELAKYNPGDGVVDKIVSALTP